MSEESLPSINISPDPVELEKKILAWGKFGKQLYNADLVLQAQAQAIANKLVDPISVELISQAEEALAIVRKDHAALQQYRLSVTNKFSPVIGRLMEPEKTLLACINKTAEAILKQKQAEKEAQKTEAAKAKELKDIATEVRVYVADMHAAYLSSQLSLLSKAYEYALSTSLSMEALPAFMQKLIARVTIADRKTPLPKPKFQYNTQEVVDKAVLDNFDPWPAKEYVDGFELDVKNKFSDWATALQNKTAAKKLNDDAIAETTAAIDDQKTRQTTAAKLEALSIPLTDGGSTKQLKEAWQIAEPTTVDEMFAIVNAFAVNRNLVQQYITNIKWGNVGIKQMIAALIKVKNIDESFECTGIIFNKTDKL